MVSGSANYTRIYVSTLGANNLVYKRQFECNLGVSWQPTCSWIFHHLWILVKNGSNSKGSLKIYFLGSEDKSNWHWTVAGAASANAQWESGKNSQLPPTDFPDFKHIFFIQQGALQALQSLNSSGIPSCWEFYKAKFPREFQQRCSGSQTPLALWPNLKAQLQKSLPHSRLSVTCSVAPLSFLVCQTAGLRVTLESESSLDGAGLYGKHHHTHCHFHAIHFYNTLWL